MICVPCKPCASITHTSLYCCLLFSREISPLPSLQVLCSADWVPLDKQAAPWGHHVLHYLCRWRFWIAAGYVWPSESPCWHAPCFQSAAAGAACCDVWRWGWVATRASWQLLAWSLVCLQQQWRGLQLVRFPVCVGRQTQYPELTLKISEMLLKPDLVI